MLLEGADYAHSLKHNPFYSALRGRLADLTPKSRFTGDRPVLDTEQLIQELKDPDRELSGYEEMELLMRKYPFAKLINTLSNGSVLYFTALQNHAEMSPKEQDTLRQEMLDHCLQAKSTLAELQKIDREEMKAFFELADNAKRFSHYRDGSNMAPQKKEALRQEILKGCEKIHALSADMQNLSEEDLTALSKMYSPGIPHPHAGRSEQLHRPPEPQISAILLTLCAKYAIFSIERGALQRAERKRGFDLT